MAEQYKIIVKVVSQKGTCEAKPTSHKVGDEWVIEGDHVPAGMCMYAFNSLFPFITSLTFGGTFPWEPNPDITTVACPDAQNPVVFELKRSRK